MMSTNTPNPGQWGDPAGQQPPAQGQWGNPGGYQQPPAYQQPTGPVQPGQWNQPGQYGAPAQQPGSTFTWPLTIRESALGAVGVLIFGFSFANLNTSGFGGYVTLWTLFLGWTFFVALPVIASGLVVARAFFPAIRRVGSLSVDQFASVAYSFLLGLLIVTLLTLAQAGGFLLGGSTPWVIWVLFVLYIAGAVLSLAAPHIPGLREEFDGRAPEESHRIARTARFVPPRAPRAPAAPQQGYQPTGAYNPQQGFAPVPQPTGSYDPQSFQQPPAPEPQSYGQPPAPEPQSYGQPPAYEEPAFAFGEPESTPADAPAEPAAEEVVEIVAEVTDPFWALVPVVRDVVDEQSGATLFQIGPDAWALVVADRGSSYLIRHDDGRVGVLHDVSDITRG